MRRILRWDVPIDDQPHGIGAGPVVHVDCRPPQIVGLPADRVEVWTEERMPDDGSFPSPTRKVQVFGTGHQLPTEVGRPLGSTQHWEGRLMWHLYTVRGD